MSEKQNNVIEYTWTDCKDATNRLYRELFGVKVDDFVGTVANNSLPSCVTTIMAHVGAYPNCVVDDNSHDIELLRSAYKQLHVEGKIGY